MHDRNTVKPVSYKETATHWYVFTGAPSSGKTTLLIEMAKRGYQVVPEVARAMIESGLKRGRTLHQIRGDKKAFERVILEKKVSIEKGMRRDEVVFFDRAIPDSIAYFKLAGLDPEEAISQSPRNHYRAVFLLDRLPFEKDPVRIEEPDSAKALEGLLEESYTMLGYDVIRLPVLSIKKRLEMVLGTVRKGME